MSHETSLSIAVAGIKKRYELEDLMKKIEELTDKKLNKDLLRQLWRDAHDTPISRAVQPWGYIWNK